MSGLELEPHWAWLLAAIILAIAELIVPGVFLIWLAAAAAATGLIALAFDIALPFQLGLFALISIAAVYFGRRWYLANPMPSADPLERSSHSASRGITRTTGVCWSMNSLTRVPQAGKPSRRQGRSRAFSRNQSTIAAESAGIDAAGVDAAGVDPVGIRSP